jgi:hypothetical protein
MTHGHRDFTVCSCSLLPVLLPGAPSELMCSTTADVSGEPAMRSARAKARRRIASCAHCGMGCSHAPRPGRLPATSTVTAYLPFPVDTATTRTSSTANSRFRQPTHVRTGPPMRRCAEAEVSRWITAQFTFTEPVVRTTRQPFADSELTAATCRLGNRPCTQSRRPARRVAALHAGSTWLNRSYCGRVNGCLDELGFCRLGGLVVLATRRSGGWGFR